MDKYKDFRDLHDTNEQTLRDLFHKRIYQRYLKDRFPNDIIISDVSVVSKWIGDKPIIKRIDFNPDKKVSTYEERMELKKMNASAAYTFTQTNETEEAEFELSFLNLSEIENRYLRKRVEAYRKVCHDIIKRAISNEEVEKPKVSWRRVYSFILAEAFKRGESKIRDMSKNSFLRYVSVEMEFKGVVPHTIYQTVRSTYRGEDNYLNFFEEMKKKYHKEYSQSMKLFSNYYPNLQISQDKK